MRLAEHSLHSYRLPYARPVRWSDMVEDAAQFMLLRLVSGTGHSGVAEMTIKPSWTGASLRSMAAAINDIFLPLLQTLDLSSPETVRARLEAIPENHAVKALIDNAVWDLHAVSSQTPAQASGGSDTVPLSFTVTRQAPEKMVAEAVQMVDQFGFQTLKIKGGQGVDVDVAAMRLLRAEFGSQTRLYVDANSAYPAAEALHYVQAMADAGAEVVEDPCALSPDGAFTQLQQASATPVLIDFACWSPRDTRLFIAAGARAFSLKPGRFGLSDTLAMSRLASAAGCRAVVGMFGESALGTLTALQLAAGLPPGSLPAETSWFLAMTGQVTHEPLKITGGAVRVPAATGNAARIDWKRLEQLV